MNVEIGLTLEVRFTNSVATLKAELLLFPHFSEEWGFFSSLFIRTGIYSVLLEYSEL